MFPPQQFLTFHGVGTWALNSLVLSINKYTRGLYSRQYTYRRLVAVVRNRRSNRQRPHRQIRGLPMGLWHSQPIWNVA